MTARPPIVVTEASGAQVLPNVNDERATTIAWCANLACNADLRTISPVWQAIASSLIVKAVTA